MPETLQDFVAFFAAAPSEREVARARLERSGMWRQVCTSDNGWVIARRPLLEAEELGRAAGPGLAFAEGEGRLLRPGDADARRQFQALVDQCPDRLDTLPGDFTFVRLRAGGAATAVRSAGGRAPVYYHASSARTVVTTRFGAIAELAPAHLGLDPLANACLLSTVPAFPDGRAPIHETFLLPAGHYVVLGAHGRRVTQYWDPLRRFVPLPSPRSALEHIQHLRSQLLRYLERELDPNGGNLLLLSGGVDSSILAVLSRHSLNRPLMTLSLVPPDGHPARLGEVSLINRLGDRLGVEHRWFFGTELDHLESALVAAPDSGFHFFHFMLALVPQLRRERAIRVVLGGDFADDLFGGPQLLPAWAAHAPAGSLLLRDRLPVGRRDWARWAKHRARKWTGNPQLALPPPLSAVFAPAVRLEHAEWAEATKGRLVSDERPFHHLAALLAQRDWVVTAWEASAAVGVHRALPFLSREAIELAAVLHPVEHFGPGTKKALRAAAGEIPPKFLERHEKLHWSALGEPDPLVPWGRNIPEGLGFLVNPQLIECPPPYVRRSERSSLELLMLFADRLNRRRAQADLRSAD